MDLKPMTLMALSIALAGPAAAAEPNIKPGQWETTSTITMKAAQFSMPQRTETNVECVTAEKIAKGQAFLEDNQDCTFSRKEMRADGMDYAMTCKNPEGGTVKMNSSMQFNGETMTGTVDGTMESPMGPMTMKIDLAGKRTGSCSP